MCSHPILDRDNFLCLTYVRQREILKAMYGGELPDFDSIPAPPSWFFFHVPDSIPLTALLRRRVELERSAMPTPAQYREILTALQAHVTPAALTAACTARGRGETFKSAKPHDGVYAFIWRMGRFHSGAADKVSFEALWELEEGIIMLTGIQVRFDLSPEQKPILKFVNDAAKDLTASLGEDPMKGTLRFGRAVGMGI